MIWSYVLYALTGEGASTPDPFECVLRFSMTLPKDKPPRRPLGMSRGLFLEGRSCLWTICLWGQVVFYSTRAPLAGDQLSGDQLTLCHILRFSHCLATNLWLLFEPGRVGWRVELQAPNRVRAVLLVAVARLSVERRPLRTRGPPRRWKWRKLEE